MNSLALGLFYAALTGLCWAVLAVGLKYALHFSSAGTIAWVRMIVAFVILFVFYLFKSPQRLKKALLKPPIKLLLAGLFLACNYYGYMRGIDLTNATNAQIMIQIGPLTLLLIGIFFFKEQLRLIQWLGVIIASLGFVFFNWDQVLIALENSDRYIAGNVWIIFAAITWALFAAIQKFVFTRDLDKSWPPQLINLLIYGVCCIALYPVANLNELVGLTAWQYFVMFLLGFNTLIAYGAFGEAMRLIPASYVSLVITLNPLLTILFVYLLTIMNYDIIPPEPMNWRGILGAFLVVFGVGVAVSLRARKKREP